MTNIYPLDHSFITGIPGYFTNQSQKGELGYQWKYQQLHVSVIMVGIGAPLGDGGRSADVNSNAKFSIGMHKEMPTDNHGPAEGYDNLGPFNEAANLGRTGDMRWYKEKP